MRRLYGNSCYDDFGNEWRFTIHLDENGDCVVNCRKFGSFNKVFFIFSYCADYIHKALVEIDKRIN